MHEAVQGLRTIVIEDTGVKNKNFGGRLKFFALRTFRFRVYDQFSIEAWARRLSSQEAASDRYSWQRSNALLQSAVHCHRLLRRLFGRSPGNALDLMIAQALASGVSRI
jgi:hypothetical protein